LRGVPSCRLPAIGKLGSCRHGEQAGVRRSAADDSPLLTRVHEFMLGQDASRQGAVAVAVLPGHAPWIQDQQKVDGNGSQGSQLTSPLLSSLIDGRPPSSNSSCSA